MTEIVINVGIAAFGMSGKIFHAPFLNADKRFNLKKVFERTSNKAQEEYPLIQTVRSFEELLEDDINLVIICTPNALHYPMAKQALEAGKNVIVEKPICISSEQASELIELAKGKNLVFTVFQNRRFDGDFLTVKRLIKEGLLGKVVDYEAHYDRFVQNPSSKEWKSKGGQGINILYDLGVHLIDQAYSIFGKPQEVYADFRKQLSFTPDFDNFEVILYYKDKKAILKASQVVANPGPHFLVHGTKGSFIKYGMDPQEENLVKGLRPPIQIGVDCEENYGTMVTIEDRQRHQEQVETTVGDYAQFYSNVYDTIVNNRKLVVKPEQALDVLKIIEAAILSNKTKQRERV